MGILQEKRVNVPKPDVQDTGYGVQYVNVQSPSVAEDVPAVAEDVPAVDDAVISSDAEVKPADDGQSVAPKRRGGRIKRSRKGE